MGQVRLNQAKVILTAHRQAGPHVRKLANLTIQGARRLAPRGSHRSGSGERQPGQALVPSLVIDSTTTIDTIIERVGSRKRYAATVHQGSSPHRIEHHGRMLKFQWERGNLLIAARAKGRIRGGRLRRKGNYFFFKMVNHPGNKRPVRYLTTPMHLYGKMLGFRTTSTPASRSRLP